MHGGPTTSRLTRARPAAVALVLAIAILVAGVGTGALPFGFLGGGSGGAPAARSTGTPTAGPLAAGAAAAAEPTSTPSPTPSPTPVPTPPPVAAATNGVLYPASEASLATRHPLAIMIDDAPAARPQAGLSNADIVYQAPAEGGIPRYMLIYQGGDAPSIGPIRSSRLYFVAWAAEWRAVYAHVGGAPNALAYIQTIDKQLIWNADEYNWPQYMPRITTRVAPHNVYTSSAKLRELGDRLGATAPFTTPAWTFEDGAPLSQRPTGGSITVPYPANVVSYTYDRATNRYLRSVSGGQPQIDTGTHERVAPYDVIVQYVAVGPLLNTPTEPTNQLKGRLELGYLGSGNALVFRDGIEIEARWSKTSAETATQFTYASGPLAGQPVPLVRGQIFVQVVPDGTHIQVTPGTFPTASQAAPR